MRVLPRVEIERMREREREREKASERERERERVSNGPHGAYFMWQTRS